MNQVRRSVPLLTLLALLLLVPLPAGAMPGVLVGKSAEKRIVHSTHIVIMRGQARNVVTVMPDYEGPFEPFAVIMPVPYDVTAQRVNTLKRDTVDRVEQLTAPKIHHFWEKDPCALGKAKQVWERDLHVQEGAGVKMMGGPQIDFSGGRRKVPRELSWVIEPQFKEGEYGYTVLQGTKALEAGDAEQADGKAKKAKKAKKAPEEAGAVVPPASDWVAFLKGKGYQVAPEAEKALAPYLAAGMNLLVAEVDDKKIELVGGERAQLSPIRYFTMQPLDEIPLRAGVFNIGKAHDVFIYVLDHDSRFEVGNYPSIYPPLNVELREMLGKVWVQERMPELYAAIHDRLAAKHKGVFFLKEYAWPTETCGEPCASEPLLLYELITLGGDLLELDVSDEERNPEAEPYSEKDEELIEAELKELKPAERKETRKRYDEERVEVARRKALAKRHKYILSRVHARYNAAQLTKDVELKAAGPVEGGDAIPKGPKGEVSTDVKPAKSNKLQVRFNTMHPWKGVIQCQEPKRWRWGLEWMSVRRLNKIWVAQDLTRKRRGSLKPEDVILSPVPELGIEASEERGGADAGVPDAGATEEAEVKDDGCGCRTAGRPLRPTGAALAMLLGAAALWRRRRR